MQIITFIFLCLLAILVPSKAYEACDGPDKNGFSTLLVCYDTYYKYSFCCGWNGDHYTVCCFATKIWALWYFWFALGAFVFIVGGCIGGFLRWRKNRNGKSESASSSEAEVEQQVVFVASQTIPEQQVSIDVPPSYQETVGQAAVVSQSNEMTKLGAVQSSKDSDSD